MTDSHTKNYWILTLDHYKPVLITAGGDLLLEADFSLAEENVDSAIRLRRLMDFIRQCRLHVEDLGAEQSYASEFGISQKVVEQIVYLAYWKNYRLELGITRNGSSILAHTHFPGRPELNCVLDQFPDDLDTINGLQDWLDFFHNIIAEHADIWQIHLVLDKGVCKQLVMPENGKVLVEVCSTSLNERLPDLLKVPS
jgi:hypothetical protein